ncbi:UPF0193 protein EVG1 homolog [Chrysoperla carnea]|uniref:UPF0193 protein EVG1 homolog n=1 Tax=Chrysoperla carnea TaxID=189513 RepID=UPI001D072870|nr:UPF0193 protein EVG1 homolog [Chrysoperla carnea]
MSEDWWPSKRIPRGGLLQPAKVEKYSPETHKFLNELMEESKLTMQQRNKFNYHLRTGEPFPTNTRSRSVTKFDKQPRIVLTNTQSQLRSQTTIINSGAYERDKFTPNTPIINREEAKLKLQELMEHGKEALKQKTKAKQHGSGDKKEKTEEPKYVTRFDELKAEIQERIDWLEEMRQLGQDKPYRDVIHQQIAAKLKEIENLKLE